jgi:hypothetical protein
MEEAEEWARKRGGVRDQVLAQVLTPLAAAQAAPFLNARFFVGRDHVVIRSQWVAVAIDTDLNSGA